MDYYCLRFFEKSHSERQQYLTTSRIFSLRQALNENPEKTLILRDKFLFNQKFTSDLGRQFWSWEQLLLAPELPSTLVMKDRWGQSGEKIRVISESKDKTSCIQQIRSLTSDPSKYLYESHISQHPLLQAFYPDVVNTLRVLTCLGNNQVEIWGVMLSIGTQEHVDNFTQGGIALPVNTQGMTYRRACYLAPDLPLFTHHPSTKHALIGFQVPFFQDALTLCHKAAKALPDIRIVSWDVAIQPDGPCLIEGNHNWNAFIQIPSNQGLAPLARSVASLSPYD